MPSLPTWPIEDETDEALAEHHVRGLSWPEERAVAACSLSMTDENLASLLRVTVETVRGQRFRAAHHVFDTTELEPNRVRLGRWCGFHWDWCLVRVAARIREGTWLAA